jgi:hypothetical protein
MLHRRFSGKRDEQNDECHRSRLRCRSRQQRIDGIRMSQLYLLPPVELFVGTDHKARTVLRFEAGAGGGREGAAVVVVGKDI